MLSQVLTIHLIVGSFVFGTPVSTPDPIATDHTYTLPRRKSFDLTTYLNGILLRDIGEIGETGPGTSPKTFSEDVSFGGAWYSSAINEETSSIMRCLGECISRAFPTQPASVENVLGSRRKHLSDLSPDAEIIDLCEDSCFSEYTDAVSPLEVEGYEEVEGSESAGNASFDIDFVDLTDDSVLSSAENHFQSTQNANGIDANPEFTHQMTLDEILDNYECIPEDYMDILYEQLVLSGDMR